MFLYYYFTRSPDLTGAEDGCYTDWSLDLLVAKKVGETDKFPGPHSAVVFFFGSRKLRIIKGPHLF